MAQEYADVHNDYVKEVGKLLQAGLVESPSNEFAES